MSQELLQDDAAHQAHVAGIEAVNAWIGGRVRYSLSSTTPASGLVIDARIDPSAEGCKDSRAFFDGRFNPRGEITGGEIVYCGLDVARTGTVTHELGHSVGLQHSFVRREEMMALFFSRSRSSVFSPREGPRDEPALRTAGGECVPGLRPLPERHGRRRASAHDPLSVTGRAGARYFAVDQ